MSYTDHMIHITHTDHMIRMHYTDQPQSSTLQHPFTLEENLTSTAEVAETSQGNQLMREK